MTTRALSLGLSGVLFLWQTQALAQVDEAARQKLTEEGVLFYQQQKFAEACDRLAAANRIRKDAATVNFEAGCYEKLGRLASASTKFAEAKALADRDQDPEIAAAAAANAARLEPRLASVTIHLGAGALVGGSSVVLDGKPVPADRVGAPIAVDAGTHELRIERPGQSPIMMRIEVVDGESKPVDIPPATKPAPPIVSAAVPQESGGPTLRYLGMGGVGVGAVALGAGLYFGVAAKSSWDDAKAAGCSGEGVCQTADGAARVDDAHSKGTLSTVLVVAGIGVGVAGALLWAMAPSSMPREGPAKVVGLSVDIAPGSLVVRGAF